MSETMNAPTARDAFAAKAEENLTSAASEHASRRYNACMNRCYYACFQAAIAALISAGILPRDRDAAWGHAFVQAQFSGVLINRRHLYAAELRDVLIRLLSLRRTADYEPSDISEAQATRAVRRTEHFVRSVPAGERRP